MPADTTCRVCGATGFAPCDLTKHLGSIVGFRAAMARLDAQDECRCAACVNGKPFECIRRKIREVTL